MDASFPADVTNRFVVFPLCGRMIKSQVPLFMRLMMGWMEKRVKDPVRRKMFEDFDFVQKENISPLVKELKIMTEKA
jgi:hypothetical protein